MNASRGDRWIDLGVVGRPRGLRGDLWFRAYNEMTETLRAGLKVRATSAKGEVRTLTVASVEEESKGLLVTFEGVEGRDAAEGMVNTQIALQRKHFAPLDEGEYYHCDLPGLAVRDASGATVGEVLGVEAYPTVDALRVKVGDEELEVPVTGDYVLAMDLDGGTVTVDLDAVRAE
jgi:16S rRNA processing protein RimM